MDYIFSKHADEQIKHRNISKSSVCRVLDKPDEVIDEQSGLKIFQSAITENGVDFLLRVFVNMDKYPPLIVTAYKTTKFSKYYENSL